MNHVDVLRQVPLFASLTQDQLSAAAVNFHTESFAPDAIIFLEEHPGSIQDGYLEMGLTSPDFPDVPGALHGGSGGISFADGHAIVRKWITPVLLIPVTQGTTVHHAGTTINGPMSATNPDWLWVRDHSSAPTPP